MSQIKEYIRIALMNIRANRGRSILTMLGIIIGISSVILIITIGNGVQGSVNSGLNSIAGGQIYIYYDGKSSEAIIEFDESDFDAVNDVEHVVDVSPSMSFYGSLTGLKGEFDAIVEGGYPANQTIKKYKMAYGRFYSESDLIAANPVIVISESDSMKLFGTKNSVGLDVEFACAGVTQSLEIIGVTKSADDSGITSMLMGSSIQADMPITALGSLFAYNVETFDSFYVLVDEPENSSEVARQSVKMLENKKNVRGANSIKVESFAEEMDSINEVIGYVKVFISVVAAISLLVGGIGVMNIMLVSVSERTREIGIRKSLGARTSSIMMQFVFEAAIIALCGGIIGIVTGTLGAVLVCKIIGVDVVLQAGTIILASSFSCGIGIIFGVYPAKKAAKLRPIDALRHE